MDIGNIDLFCLCVFIRRRGVDQHRSLPFSWHEDICGHTSRYRQQRMAGTLHKICCCINTEVFHMTLFHIYLQLFLARAKIREGLE